MRLLDDRLRPLAAESVALGPGRGPGAGGRTWSRRAGARLRPRRDGRLRPARRRDVRRRCVQSAGVRGRSGEALPARPFAGTVEPGQAVRIMTGAPLPDGAPTRSCRPRPRRRAAGRRGAAARAASRCRRGATSAGAARTSRQGGRALARRPAPAAAGRRRARVGRRRPGRRSSAGRRVAVLSPATNCCRAGRSRQATGSSTATR